MYIRKSSRLVSCSLFFFSLISFSLSSCDLREDAPPSDSKIEVPVITLHPQEIPVQLEFIGETKGAVDADIRARIEGVIQQIHFNEGREVSEGQLLYTIDPAPFNARLSEMQAKLVEAQTRLVKADADLGRIKPLAEMRAVSQRDLDTAVAQQGVARSAVDVARAGVDVATIDLSYTKIQSPLAGIIGLTKARVGEFVGRPPNAVVLNTVSKLDPIHVRFSVTEKEYLYFARERQRNDLKGENPPRSGLRLILADNSIHPESGTVSSVDSQINPATGSMAVEASFPNPGKILRPGQFAKVQAQKELLKDAIVVPKKAVRELQGLKQVQVVTPDNTIETRAITIQQDLGDRLVIEKGLVSGERIVPEIQQRLKSGTSVFPKELQQTGALELENRVG